MTATKIILSDDKALTVSRALTDVQKSFYEALENGGWVLINGDDGHRVSVNPRRVLYLEEVSLPPASDRANGSDLAEAPDRPQATAAR